jgi:hypothetical protein
VTTSVPRTGPSCVAVELISIVQVLPAWTEGVLAQSVLDELDWMAKSTQGLSAQFSSLVSVRLVGPLFVKVTVCGVLGGGVV